MRTWNCACGSSLFFGNDRCTKCDAVVGMCPSCWSMVAGLPVAGLPVAGLPAEGQQLRCTAPDCRARMRACGNSQLGVCNCFVSTDDSSEAFCTFCRLNQMVPDLAVDGNQAKWRKLESAKRRVLYTVRQLGLPLGPPADGDDLPPLRFSFQADVEEPVPTGHLNGLITINLREADEVERERTRVEFNEPQRTLVGHFRHELGHYYWEVLVKPHKLKAFRDAFGDESNPTYDSAQKRYYSEGPRDDWNSHFVSAYASMHPWEDFAETFGAYLDMTSLLLTASHFGLTSSNLADVASMILDYQKLGIVANELSRDMGLSDIVPEVFTEPITRKLGFVHALRRR